MHACMHMHVIFGDSSNMKVGPAVQQVWVHGEDNV